MRHATGRLLALPWVLAAAAVAGADESAWAVRLAGKDVGREVASVTSEGGRVVRVAKATVRLTDEPFEFTARLEADDAGRVLRYALESRTVTVEVTRGPDGALAFAAAVAGNPVARAAPAFAGPSLVLDNLVFSHYDALGAEAARRGAEAFDLQAVVPQALVAVAARYEPGRPVRVLGPGGAERAAREAQVTLGNVLVTFVHDVETGAASRVEVPSQALLGVREGWAPAAPQGPPPGAGGAAPAAPAPDPATFREVEVTFDAPLGPVPGTLCLPAAGEGPWPAVVLVHGSGPHDRDETLGPNAPLRDLARQLAAAGVAALRYDKRTWLLVQTLRGGDPDARAKAEAVLRELTFAGEATDDAAAAVAFLRGRPDVRGVVVAGHSQGALAAAELAARADSGLAGVAVLAGPGRPFDVLLAEQVAYQGGLQGLSPEEARAQAEKVAAPLRDGGKGLSDVQMVLGASGRYWKDLLARDPCATLAATRVPVLLLQGEADCQVRPADHERLAAALAARPAGGPPVEARLLPGLNHLFMAVKGRSTGAEYHTPGHVAPEVGAALGGWVKALSAP